MDEVVVAGRGKLAQALITGLKASPFEIGSEAASALIYAGSGRELNAAINYCAKNKVPLIQAATGITHPENPPFPYIIAPNLALAALQFIEAIEPFVAQFPKAQVELTESHQQAKKSAAGTAEKIAKRLGLESFSSIRDPKEQKQRFQIPNRDLEHHALHEVKITSGEVEIRAEVRVMGPKPYVEGAKRLLELELCELKPGLYCTEDLIQASSSPLSKSAVIMSQPPISSPQT